MLIIKSGNGRTGIEKMIMGMNIIGATLKSVALMWKVSMMLMTLYTHA